MKCEHCWHNENYTHAVYIENGYHEDKHCCKCKEKICRNVVLPIIKPEGCLE